MNKTQIFQTLQEFLYRKDVTVNGVTLEFAVAHPGFEKMNETNSGCWCCTNCSNCSDCTRCTNCSNCSDCTRCFGCSDCIHCSNCSDCTRCTNYPLTISL